MLKIKIPFGFKMIQIENHLVIYTGKIRIKAEPDALRLALQNYAEHLTFVQSRGWGTCTTITFCTTNALLNRQLIYAINQTIAQIMHNRIDRKYNCNATVFNPENIEDYLPF